MQFRPKSQDELRDEREAKRQLLDIRATYDFEVFNVAESTSKRSGKDMLVLTINVHHDGGTKQFVDYIVPDTQMDKLYEFCQATGQLDAYGSGNIHPDDFSGAGGKLKLAIEKGSAAPDGGFYPDKNKIGRYLAPGAATKPAMASAPRKAVPDDDDDDIPF